MIVELLEEVMTVAVEEIESRKPDPLDDAESLDEILEQMAGHEDPDYQIEDGVWVEKDDRLYEEFGFMQGHVKVGTGRKTLVPPSAE